MLCRFVFSLWWSVFVWGVWSHLNQPLHMWTVDRHDGETVTVSKTFTPIVFANASVLWLDMLKDSVHLDLQKTTDPDIGTVEIKSASMFVYDNGFRDSVVERYDIILTNVTLEDAHLDLMQDDVHLSPFRRIEVVPEMKWSLGSSDVPDFERFGYFKNGKWYEGRDAAQLGFGALFAWCVGVIFLVVMRRGSGAGTVVVKRKKRIFKQRSINRFI